MNLLEKRKDNARLILEKRYIREVLSEESKSILDEQKKVMSSRGFSSGEFYSAPNFKVSDSSSRLEFYTVHRFADMKTRRTKSGTVKKRKAHPIYNRIIFGHIPNIVRRLSYGFTDAVIEEMKKLENKSSNPLQ